MSEETAERLAKAKLKYQAISSVNTYGKSAEELAELEEEYEQSWQELKDAKRAHKWKEIRQAQ